MAKADGTVKVKVRVEPDGSPIGPEECRLLAEQALADEEPLQGIGWALLALLGELRRLPREMRKRG